MPKPDKEIRFCVCQDCNHIEPFTHEKHNEEELCKCGGQLCGCDFCNIEYASHLKPKLISRI